MGWKNWLDKGKVPLPPEEAARVGLMMKFGKNWICGCGAKLNIRSRVEHESGESNFVPDAKGHSKVPSHELTWDGLAEERGWKVNPTVCPACQAGLTVEDYKKSKR